MDQRTDDRMAAYAPDDRAEGSTALSMLVGGLMVAVAVMAFLFYDGRAAGMRDIDTTGSVAVPAASAPTPAGAITRPRVPAVTAPD